MADKIRLYEDNTLDFVDKLEPILRKHGLEIIHCSPEGGDYEEWEIRRRARDAGTRDEEYARG